MIKKLNNEEYLKLKQNLEIIDLFKDRKGNIRVEYQDKRDKKCYIYYLLENQKKEFLKRYDFWLS